MKNFYQRMYEQGLILGDYEKGKPLCDEVERIEKKFVDEGSKLQPYQFLNLQRKLNAVRKEALSFFVRNPAGSPNPKHLRHAH